FGPRYLRAHGRSTYQHGGRLPRRLRSWPPRWGKASAVSLELPTLSTSDLQEELRLIHRRERRALSAAGFGRGAPGMVSVDLGDRRVLFRAAPVRSELDMRRELAKEGEEQVVLLVDFEQRLPADLLGRLAGGKVHAVDRGRRLARMFGATAA